MSFASLIELQRICDCAAGQCRKKAEREHPEQEAKRNRQQGGWQ